MEIIGGVETLTVTGATPGAHLRIESEVAGHVATVVAGGRVTVTVSFVDRTDAPLVGWLLPDVTLTASATMLLEPP